MRPTSLKEPPAAQPIPDTSDNRRRVRFALPDSSSPDASTALQRPTWHAPLPLGRSAPAGPGASGNLPPRRLYPLPALPRDVLQSIEAEAVVEKKKILPTNKTTVWIPERADNASVEHLPGTAAYYNSTAFKDVVAAGKDQVPGRTFEKPEVSIDAGVERSIVLRKDMEHFLTFSRSRARQARVKTKVSDLL
jgi:hypothetical protein